MTPLADETDVEVANRLIAILTGMPLVQFRMGYGVHLELGNDHEITIETPLEVVDADERWRGQPLTADAAGVLLQLVNREVTSQRIAEDGTLEIGFASARLTVPPHESYEAWQVRGPDGLSIVCAPGGDYIAVWEPQSRP
jgi:hypothetical protein